MAFSRALIHSQPSLQLHLPVPAEKMIEVQVNVLPSLTRVHSCRRQSCVKVMLHRAAKLPPGALVYPHFRLAEIKKSDWQQTRVIQSVLLGNSASPSSLKNPSLVHCIRKKTRQNKTDCSCLQAFMPARQHIYTFCQLKCGN